ncbi:universal stress protein [Streptomyces lunaelactis]|uniref:universal stress protein n=1 Tax=Streptomyces lunaelactis TaxID=1535768 RepID=UPI0015847E82|nr:universal stress protein [Streptomyces lunaelactis]NUK02732.1 universal stress protein [Streptomyces lunaelactis]NUK16772.1 universal stress protein [Streptomyces lunaelactis]
MAQAHGDMLLPWRQKFHTVDVVEKPVPGSATRQLSAAAEGADLVVVGRSHPARSAWGPHIGHVAHAVIEQAASPVAVVAHNWPAAAQTEPPWTDPSRAVAV